MAEAVAMLSVSLLTRATVEQRASLRSSNLARAFHLAEAGVDLAIQALRTDPDYTGAPYADLGTHTGGYAIQVARDGPSHWTIRATGSYPANDPAAVGYSVRAIEVVVQLAKGAGPGYGVLGDRSIRFDGGDGDEVRMDSYDSRQGPYASQGARANVRLCTNAHQERAVALVGGVTLLGDVVLGPGSDPERTLWRTPREWISISGSVSVADVGAPVEPVDMPLLPDRGRLHISGHEVVTLPEGLYRFRDLQISGHGRLEFTGPAEVYVEEDVEIAGDGIGTAAQLPPNLALYVKGSRVSISGETDLFAKLNAPDALIELSGHSDLYGSVSGREIVVRGHADIHYDEALNSYDEALSPPRSTDPLQATVLSWREVDP